MTEPDPNYHGISYAKDIGEAAYVTKSGCAAGTPARRLANSARFFFSRGWGVVMRVESM